MPELPEVETIVRDIRPALRRPPIARVSLSHDDVLRGVTRRRLVRGLPAPGPRRVPPCQARGHRYRHPPARGAARDDRSLVVHDRAARRRRASLCRARAAARRRPRAGLPRRPPVRHAAPPGRAAAGSATTARSAPSRSTRLYRRRLGERFGRSRAGGQEGAHGPAAPRGRREHLRQRGAVRGGIDPSKPARQLTPDDHRRLHAEIRRGFSRRRSGPMAPPYATTAPAPASRAISSSSCWCTAARASPAAAAAPASPARTRSTHASPSSAIAASREPAPPPKNRSRPGHRPRGPPPARRRARREPARGLSDAGSRRAGSST